MNNWWTSLIIKNLIERVILQQVMVLQNIKDIMVNHNMTMYWKSNFKIRRHYLLMKKASWRRIQRYCFRMPWP